MIVSELCQGMVLRVNRPDYFGWIPQAYTHWSGEDELRFVNSALVPILTGRKIEHDEMIIYLGADTQEIPKKIQKKLGGKRKTETLRRVMIGTKTAVVKGHNFKFLEPHPEFLDRQATETTGT